LQGTLRPAPFIQYLNESEMVSLVKDITSHVQKRYAFPVDVKTANGTVPVVAIEPQFLKGAIVPLVKYVSRFPPEDAHAAELRAEAKSMTKDLERVFPGLTKDVECVAYRAFSEPPTKPGTRYVTYGVIDKLK
jgi:hypothetical protein